MGKEDPAGLAVLQRELGMTPIGHLQAAIVTVLGNARTSNRSTLVWNSSAGDQAMVASLKDIVDRMAEVTERRLMWSNAKKKSIPKSLNRISMSRLSATNLQNLSWRNSLISKGASPTARITGRSTTRSTARSRLTTRSRSTSKFFGRADASPSRPSNSSRRQSDEYAPPELVDRESLTHSAARLGHVAAFIVFAGKEQRLSHARVLKAELSHKLNRYVGLGTKAKAVDITRASALVVMLCGELLTTPQCIIQIYAAVEARMPIITVLVDGGGFDFAAASRQLSEPGLWGHGLSDDEFNQPLSEALAKLPTKPKLEDVQGALRSTITAIVAIPWQPHGRPHHVAAVMTDIAQTIPKQKSKWEKMRQMSRQHNVIGLHSPTRELVPNTPAREDSMSSLKSLSKADSSTSSPLASRQCKGDTSLKIGDSFTSSPPASRP